MSKGYWITFYRKIMDPARLSEYAELAGPAIVAGGGRFLARGMPVTTFEGVRDQRAVVVEFDSVEQAIAAYRSAAYQAALAKLEGAVERDVRIMEGAG
jgi:uncharacterized protein (DUF1330 family)